MSFLASLPKPAKTFLMCALLFLVVFVDFASKALSIMVDGGIVLLLVGLYLASKPNKAEAGKA